MQAFSGHGITEKYQKIRSILFQILVPLPRETPETAMVTGFFVYMGRLRMGDWTHFIFTEALEALAAWLPEAERFAVQVKGTQDYIDQLVDISSTLSKKLSMEAAHMKHTLKTQQRLIDKIPQEALVEMRLDTLKVTGHP